MATEREARERGYVFTGIYGWDKEVIKDRQKAEFIGYKTLLVNVPASPLSRGGMTGYSVYVEPRYERDRRISKLRERIIQEDDRLAHAKAEYEALVASIKTETQSCRDQLKQLQEEN